ncbi:HOMEOBOX PROTEIN BEL1-like protein [Salix viminalis]|uniref:HOMEOBOX PROTEIN BEL1-like protein n=1 Tax=Salix viminalis TaxID=40686 RepID=A0A9Q0YYB8_SALVM|nr:HOMEOBOX PROTEIN BEL1-like protein [Salix viminalis]
MVSSGSFCYTDGSSSNPAIQTHLVNQIHGFESNPEMFNLTTGMEMIGFSKNLQQQKSDSNSSMWKGFFNKPPNTINPGGPSSSKTINDSTSGVFYQHEFSKPDFSTGISDSSNENLMAGPDHSAPWQENRLLVDDSSLRCVFPCEGNERPSQGLSLSLCSSNPSSIGLQPFELRHTPTNQNQDNQQEEMRSFGKSPANIQQQMMQAANLHHQGQFQLRSSKFMGPAQDLLNEFCSLGTKQGDELKQKFHKPKQWDDDQNGSSSRKQPLQSLEFIELQKRKTKLLSMLEEVDRRYRHYRDQMKAVVSSFEAVAGTGAASKATGEKDPVAPGTTRGETPRLKVLDQALRQQRAFQQMSMMESHPWRPQRGLPERSVSVSNWFINARVRLWKPMVEEMYLEETKERDNSMASSDGVTGLDENINGRPNQNPSSTDQKPTPDQLIRIDSECLSSIISNPDKNDTNNSTKTFQSHHGVSYANDSVNNQNFNGGGVSLTLGLQQHGGSGVGLAFSPASQSSLFYPRDHIEDCQQVQYSLLDGEGQNLPYRNLMGAQLLHDLAG